MSEAEWRFEPIGIGDARNWSFGRVTAVEELYDPRIFGPRQSFRCECGKYTGENSEGIVCDKCGVKVFADARGIQHRRPGHIVFPRFIPHPMRPSRIRLSEFPIAPIAYRCDENGTPTALGRKYERLVQVNAGLRADPPPDGAADHYEGHLPLDTGPILEVLIDILGCRDADLPNSATLLGLLCRAIMTLDPNAVQIARSCGLILRVEATI